MIRACLYLAAAVALVRDTAENGHDFVVFWNAGRNLLQGLDLYSISRDGAMVYKYPPWTAFFWLPFAWLPLSLAKWAWGIVEIASLFGVYRILLKMVSRAWVLEGTLAVFWGIWAVHCIDGQVMLPALFGILWGTRKLTQMRDEPRGRWSLLWEGWILWVLSLKGLTIVPGVDIVWNSRRKVALLAGICSVVALLTLIVWFGSVRFHESGTLGELLSSWGDAARSGGSQFEAGKVRGRDNQGLPAMVLRVLAVPASEWRWDFWASCCMLGVFSSGWLWGTRKWKVGVAASARFFGLLALTVALQPLAWFHGYVWAFPYFVLLGDRAVASRRWGMRILSAMALLMVAAVTEKALGALGQTFEFYSVKAWGVLLGCGLGLWLFREGVESEN